MATAGASRAGGRGSSSCSTRRQRFLPVLDLAVEVEAADDGLEICGKDEPRGEKRKGKKYKKIVTDRWVPHLGDIFGDLLEHLPQ